MAKKQETPMIRYNQSAGWVMGVPARDLTPEEWEALSDSLKDVCLKSGCYTLPADNKSGQEA